MTYPEPMVPEIIHRHSIPVQLNNQDPAAQSTLARYHHIWTPDLRVLASDGAELYRWDGYLPPGEFAARALVAFAQAKLRLRAYGEAEELYKETLRRFPSSYAAPEAQYYLGVSQYRKDPESNDLGKQWHKLQGRYPSSEYRVKQSFKELPE